MQLNPLQETAEQLIARLTRERDQARSNVDELFACCNDMLARLRRTPVLKVRKVTTLDLPPPAYSRAGDAGLDLRAASAESFSVGELLRIPCGYAVEIPPGYEATIRPRSSLTVLGVIAHLGTIDSGYRGEVSAVLENRSWGIFQVTPGDRIAQLVVSPVARCEVVVAEQLSESERGAGGFGSTGVR